MAAGGGVLSRVEVELLPGGVLMKRSFGFDVLRCPRCATKAVFDVIERLHTDGDTYVREAATIGLLEGIQNIAGNSGINPESFVPYLQPESAKWWVELNLFWEGKSPYVGAGLKPEK